MLTEFFVHHVVGISGVLFLEHAFQTGAPTVLHGIAGRIAAHTAVSHAQCGVGVGRLRPTIHFAEAAHVDLLEFGEFVLVASQRRAINFIDQAVE